MLIHLLLTFCCAAGFLTGQGMVLVHGLGAGDPCCRGQVYEALIKLSYVFDDILVLEFWELKV